MNSLLLLVLLVMLVQRHLKMQLAHLPAQVCIVLSHRLHASAVLSSYGWKLCWVCAVESEVPLQTLTWCVQEAQDCVAELVHYVQQSSANLPAGECEVLYGRAGLLHALLFAERAVASAAIAPEHFQQLARAIVAQGQQCGAALAARGADVPQPAFMHEWHGKAYLGAAHGTTGILHVRMARHFESRALTFPAT